jgi:GalNAc-alpha-(1->4)-GalNAc-alpha-(1->3)-diNAcBac-PP-undecaprenol alpha-1,4-N-acetyl-D-galactosaminyltransferase
MTDRFGSYSIFEERSLEKATVLLGVHSLCPGGTERVVSSLLASFVRIPALEVHCILYGRSPTCFYEVPVGVTLHRPPFEFDAFSRANATLKTVRFIRKVVQSLRPAAFLNFGERWNNLVLLSASATRVPVLVADRSSPAKPLGRVHEPLRRRLYARSAGVIVQTREAAERMAGIVNGRVPVHVIPNPLFQMPEPWPSSRRCEVLFVGRLIPSKHVDRLIRIFERARHGDWRLMIVGGDAQGFLEMGNLQEMLRARGLESCVELAGTQRDVERFYRRASIFAFPSSSEGFPNALAEALSFGLPSVAYDCSAGPSDLIQDGRNGFLVPVFDDETFAKRLGNLMNDADLRNRMSQRAAASVARLEKTRIAQRFLDACQIGESIVPQGVAGEERAE